jgi:hypothetical protein
MGGDTSSGSDDWELQEHTCPICKKDWMGKNMWPCSECRKLICEACGLINRGCGDDENSSVCQRCHIKVFDGKRKYCTDHTCENCDNKSPRCKKALERRGDVYAAFIQQFDLEAWKTKHMRINYPGMFRGRYLADLVVSSDSFERGYIHWLIKEGSKPRSPQYTDVQHDNFQIYVREALELRELINATKVVPRDMRKLKD